MDLEKKKVIFLTNVNRKRAVYRMEGEERAAFSPDGHFMAYSDGPLVRLWRMDPFEELPPLKGAKETVSFVVFSPDSCKVAAAEGEFGYTDVRIWDLATSVPLVLEPPDTLAREYHWLAFSPDGAWLAGARRRTASPTELRTATGCGGVVWDAKNGKALGIPILSGVDASKAIFSRDGTRLAFAGNSSSGQEVIVNYLAKKAR